MIQSKNVPKSLETCHNGQFWPYFVYEGKPVALTRVPWNKGEEEEVLLEGNRLV